MEYQLLVLYSQYCYFHRLNGFVLSAQLHLELSKFDDRAMNLKKPSQKGRHVHFSFFVKLCMSDVYDQDAPLLSYNACACANFATLGYLQ